MKTELTRPRKTTPCCGARWLWRQISGIRLVRTEGRRRMYDARCESCGQDFEYECRRCGYRNVVIVELEYTTCPASEGEEGAA